MLDDRRQADRLGERKGLVGLAVYGNTVESRANNELAHELRDLGKRIVRPITDVER